MANASGTPERGRVIAGWLILLGLIIGGFIATVVALNQTVFSAQGFVTHYLEALDRRDVTAALATDGVTMVDGASDSLLAPDALGELSDIEIVAEEVFARCPRGDRRLHAGFSGGRDRRSSSIGPTPGSDCSRLGVRSKPDQRARGDAAARRRVHRQRHPALVSRSQPAERLAVLTPSRYVLGHDSRYLTAADAPVRVTTPNSIVPAEVDVQASAEFVSAAAGRGRRVPAGLRHPAGALPQRMPVRASRSTTGSRALRSGRSPSYPRDQPRARRHVRRLGGAGDRWRRASERRGAVAVRRLAVARSTRTCRSRSAGR